MTKEFPASRRGGEPKRAVDGVSLAVRRGEIFGLLGPNGAGKSTTVRMIATLLQPTSGTIRVCGHEVRREANEVRRHVGVVLGGERTIYWKLTGRQNLEFFASLFGMSRRRAAQRIDAVLSRVGLRDRADEYAERYSTGLRQRLVIARALLAEPEVLLLDEPTIGLDPHASQSLHEQIRALRADGHAIILTTHYMDEADALSDRVAIIDRGVVVAEGTPAALKASVGADEVLDAEVLVDLARMAALVGDIRAGSEVITKAVDGNRLSLSLRGNRHDKAFVPWLVDTARRHGAAVQSARAQPVSLRDVFLSVTGRELQS